jgi:hypothetical protein
MYDQRIQTEVRKDFANGYEFEVRLLVINAGQTLAYKVGFKLRTDVLPSPATKF